MRWTDAIKALSDRATERLNERMNERTNEGTKERRNERKTERRNEAIVGHKVSMDGQRFQKNDNLLPHKVKYISLLNDSSHYDDIYCH